METVDDEILDHALKFVDKAKGDGKPFFCWLNPTRMHVVTHLSEKYEKMRTPENGWSMHEAGMAQLDDIVGSVMKKLDGHGRRGRHDRRVHHRQRHRELHLARRRPDAVRRRQRDGAWKAASASPCIVRWPGKVPAGKVENGIISGLDWFPTFVAAAGNPNIVEELKKGKKLGDTNYKVHLDGYNQMDLITGKGPSKRHEILYFAEGTLGAVRIDDYKYRFIDQPNGWLGGTVKVDMADPREPPPRPLRAHGIDRIARVLTTGSSTSSGGSSTSSRRSRSSPRPRSSSRRCKKARASTSKR